MLFGSLLVILKNIFTSATESVFNLNGSVKVCFEFQAVIKSLYAKFQAFTINGSDEICYEACFDCSAFVACFE